MIDTYFEYRNVNHAYACLTESFALAAKDPNHGEGVFTVDESRNGPVLRITHPVLITYHQPRERVLFSPARDANPFFHLYESMWMLAGRNDLAPLVNFVKRFTEFSDNGKTLHGAYGYRWRNYYGYDQLDWIAEELIANPKSRRCVLQMWDGGRTHQDLRTTVSTWSNDEQREVSHKVGEMPEDPVAVEGTGDLYMATHGGKDVPCNTSCMFNVRTLQGTNYLDMTVTNRSNDLVWGLLGANYVHFSILLEYMAYRVGCRVGKYHTLTNNLHVYTDTFDLQRLSQPYHDWYVRTPNETNPYPLSTHVLHDYQPVWTDLCEKGVHLAADPDYLKSECFTTDDWSRTWFGTVYGPAMLAHQWHKAGNTHQAIKHANDIADTAWRIACTAWLERRLEKQTH